MYIGIYFKNPKKNETFLFFGDDTITCSGISGSYSLKYVFMVGENNLQVVKELHLHIIT